MAPLIVSVVLTCIATANAYDDFEHDAISLLQASVEVKKAATTLDIFDDDSEGSYHVGDSLACDNEQETSKLKPQSFDMHPMPETRVLPQKRQTLQAKPPTDFVDPPGAHILRALLELMIVAVIISGMYQWQLQRKERKSVCKQKSSSSKGCESTAAEAAAEAAWLSMINAASAADEVSFEKSLLRSPALTKTDAWSCTPLHFAAVGGSAAICSKLLQRGAQVNARDANDETPLHMASRAGHSEVCAHLLDAGADIDAVNMQDETAFVIAGRSNKEAACRLLADRGAGVAGMSDSELPPLVISQLVRKVFAA